MATPTTTSFWKRLWRWITTESLSTEDVTKLIGNKDVLKELESGINSYKPCSTDMFAKLQATHPDHTKLLSAIKVLQNHVDVDCFQLWEITKQFLCDISYGTPNNALKNMAFIDTRPTFLLPNIWRFYYSQRLFLLKLLQHILENKDNAEHKYKDQFNKIVNEIGLQKIKVSLLEQFEKLLSVAPPSRRIHNEFLCETIRHEWAESNLREQIAVLQCILLVSSESLMSEEEFLKLFGLFKRHGFGKKQPFNDLLEERNKEHCLRIMYLEIGCFLTIVDGAKIQNLSSWIEATKETVEGEMTKLQIDEEHTAMLLTWMMVTLQSEKHIKLFENHYQQFGATALKMNVFKFLLNLLDSAVFVEPSKCSSIVKNQLFNIMNALCDKFDGDCSISQQAGAIELTARLLRTTDIAEKFWELHKKEVDYGVVSMWNTALELFPYNFNALSTIAAGLAQAGKSSVLSLLKELSNLPGYTEVFNPNAVTVMGLAAEEAVIGKDYYPFGDATYHIEAGSTAATLDINDQTLIHFRTPLSYWAVLNHEIETSLDRRGHHQRNLSQTLQRVYEGTIVLKWVLKSLVKGKQVPKTLVSPCEGVFDVLVRFMNTDSTPLPFLVECLEVCSTLVPMFAEEIHLRLLNTGLLPRTLNPQLSHEAYAGGASFDSAAVGGYLVNVEQTTGTYDFLGTYIDMLCAFYEAEPNDKTISEIIQPGVILVLREVLPNVSCWRYASTSQRRTLLRRCVTLVNLVLQQNGNKSESVKKLQHICVYSLLHTENAMELLNIISLGNEHVERMIFDETNWLNGSGSQFITTIQRTVAIVMLALRLKNDVANVKETTPLEQLIFSQNRQSDPLRVVPRVTSCINNPFNNNFAVLCCRLLKKFGEGFQMSLFSSLEMTAYQVRVMFLDRLRDEYESTELKIAILEFVATCVGKQPGLTEAFFKMNHVRAKAEEKDEKTETESAKKETDDGSEGILGYLADYLGTVKSDVKLLHSPLLACMMELFHALWKNNMQVLVKELRENPKFWEHLTSPLFSDIQSGLRTYSQIFNVLGIELFLSRDNIDPNLKETFENFFDTNKNHLDKWINYIFSFAGRDEVEAVDKVPCWLGLLTSWKDFTTIFCKNPPISLNIAHKSKMVAPCLSALLVELEELRDGRLVVVLAELYVIMLASWKADCFDNQKNNAKQIDQLLTNTAIVYECLHPRAKKAILSIATVAISTLDYKIKGSSSLAQSIIRSVTNINSLELEKLFDDINGSNNSAETSEARPKNDDVPPIVLSLAMLEQCLELYDDMFAGLSQWFQTTHFANKLLNCLQSSLQNRRHYHTSLAALRCLIGYARSAFSKNLLLSDVDQYLWLQLLPPKFDNSPNSWKPQEWWRVYCYSLDFITMMVMKHGQFFAGTAITFVGVHLEHLVEAILMPRQIVTMDSLNLCASTLNLIVQMVKFEARWRIENINSLVGIMRSISACLHQCVIQMLRSRRSSDPNAVQRPEDQTTAIIHRTLEVLHMSVLCLLSFSPELLSLLASPAADLERWQPLVELHFTAPKHTADLFPQLTFGTLLAAICLLTKSLNHTYHVEEAGGSRSPRRRRACSCGSPGEGLRAARGDSLSSLSSTASASAPLPLPPDQRLLAAALAAALALTADQALLAVRDPNIPTRHKQLIRRELSSELTMFHDFVRKRILCAAHARPELVRNKLGAWPLASNETELKRIEEARRRRNPDELEQDDNHPKPPPPKRVSIDSMREYLLRKHYLNKCAQTPTKEPPSPVSHSTPTSDKKKDSARSSKRVSWAETTRDSDENEDSGEPMSEPAYSNLTDVQINNDDDFFHFMSVVLLYICQTE